MDKKILFYLVIFQSVVILIVTTLYVREILKSNDFEYKNIIDKTFSSIKESVTSNRVYVAGSKESKNKKISYGDTIKTKEKSFIFKVDGDVFKLKPHTTIKLKERENGFGKRVVDLISGGVLAVFKKEKKEIRLSQFGTIGIRGTGVYVSVDKTKAYICSCYGKIDIYSIEKDKKILLDIINPSGSKRNPFHQARSIHINKGNIVMKLDVMHYHTNKEMKHIEKLAGRKTPFK